MGRSIDFTYYSIILELVFLQGKNIHPMSGLLIPLSVFLEIARFFSSHETQIAFSFRRFFSLIESCIRVEFPFYSPYIYLSMFAFQKNL